MTMADTGAAVGEILTIRVFGGVGVDVDGEPTSIGGPRQRRLLALLAIRAGSVVDIDWLVENLWADDDRPEVATRALRTYVSRLRQSLPEAAQGWVETESAGYRLSTPPGAIESERFRQLRVQAAEARSRQDPLNALDLLDKALALWRGDPFRELEDLNWARASVEQLNLDRLEMLEERWEAALALGRHTQITGELATFTTEHGLRDRSARQYALALHRSGRTPEGLRVLENHRRTIADETGLDPSPAVVELERAMLAGDAALSLETAGRPLRGYRLIEEAGVGAFAVVWRGRQPSVDRDVAIKQIRSELASQAEFIRRFEAEAHLVARIEHPHIVPLIDFWRDPDSAYLVMRWLPGGTLERRLDDGPMSVADTLVLASQIGGALAAAHSHGVIHRDVKTGNILFDDADNAFLGDFGIALEASESAGPEAALSPGSPAYSSPEQIRREPLGPEADIFSLGVVIYECLTGSLPFGSMSMQDLIDHQLTEPYPSLSALRPEVPQSLSDAVAKATAKDPSARFSTVAAFLEALDPGVGPVDAVQGTFDGEITNPYKGLRAFDDGDADVFFGRERLATELIERLSGSGLASRCIIVVGPSGSGKSSVVRAGLVPAIRNGAVPGSSEWFVTTLVPGADPFESLEAALLRIAVNPPVTLLEQLRDGPRGVLRSIRRCLGSDEARVLVVVDQFEELFTGSSDDDAREFLDALALAVTDPTSPLRLVLTLRADYYDRPLAHPTFAPVLKEAAVDVTPLAPDELERAMVEPARRKGIAFEPGLVARVAAETIGQPAPLPLLQYALSELFERREGAQLTTAAYDEIGGLSGALAVRAEAIYADADGAQRTVIRRIFGRMTNPTEESADLRRRVPLADLGTDAATLWVIGALGDARLVTFDRDVGTREPTIEVAHEALLREWPRLVEWLREDIDLLRSLDAISNAATTWEEGGREMADLYRGNRLDNATGLSSAAPGRMRAVETEFVEASWLAAESERYIERRSVQRLRRLVAAVGVALVVALAAGGLALRAQQRADDEAQAALASAETAEAQTEVAEREAASALVATEQAELATLISRSAASTAEDPELALLLALEAHEREQRPDTQQAVLNSLVASTLANNTSSIDQVFDLDASCGIVVSSPDTSVQFGVTEGQVAARDLVTGAITAYGAPPEDCVAWLIDEETGRRWSSSQDALRVWTGEADGSWELQRTFDEPTWLTSFAFRPTGLMVFVTGAEGSQVLLLVDDVTGETVGASMGVEGLRLREVSDDGSLIAAVISVQESDENRLKLFDGLTGLELWDIVLNAPAAAVAFDGGAGLVIVGGADGAISSFDAATGEVTAVLETTATEDFLDIGIRPDGLIVAASQTQIELVDPRTGPTGVAVTFPGIVDATVRPDGTVLTLSFENDQFAVVDLEVSALVEFALRVEAGSAVTLANGHAGVTVPSSGRAEWIDLASGDRTHVELDVPGSGPFLAQAVFPDTSGLWGVDGTGAMARWQGGSLVEQLDMDGGYRIGARHGDLFAAVLGASGSRQASLVSLEPGAAGVLFEVDVPTAVLAHPRDDGGMYVLDAAGMLLIFDSAGEVTSEIATGVVDAAILTVDKDGEGLAVAASTGGLVIVDPLSGQTNELPDVNFAGGIAFANGGERLVVTTLDGTVQLWDIDSASMFGTLWSGSGAVVGSPSWFDESTDSVWVGSSERLLSIPLTPQRWVDRACELLTRDLTAAEWDRLVPGAIPQRSTCRSTVLGSPWEEGRNGVVPAGTIRLPEFGGIRFELDTELEVIQDRAFTEFIIEGDNERTVVDLVSPTATPDDVPVTTVEELITAMTDFVKADLVEREPIETPIGIARSFDFEVDVERTDASSWLQTGEAGWGPLQYGRFWMLDTDRGLFLVTAEADSLDVDFFDETLATAETILATIELVDL